VHFFDISTSKRAPGMVCFVHFDFEMCFAPQRHVHFFRHLNFKKCSEHGVLCAFSLGNVLRTATACALFRHLNFQKCSEHGFVHFDLEICFAPQLRALLLTSQLPTVLRAWCALCILTWKRASRHNGVHFFDISTSKSLPSMACFVHFELETCFSPQLRALFRHLNFQTCSEHGAFCTF